MKSRITAFLLIIGILYTQSLVPVCAYGEFPIQTELSTAVTTTALPEYQDWLSQWQEQAAAATGNILLIPGADETGMNFSWYSQQGGTPAVQLDSRPDFARSSIFTGKSAPICRSNGTTVYFAANHVAVKDFLKPGLTYYYRYTENYDPAGCGWSHTFTFKTQDTGSFSAILTGDSQIGASGSIPADAFNWEETLKCAVEKAPDASLLLSAGDQINYKSDQDETGVREREYAGFLYPAYLRSLPTAAAIGNHESKGTDYQFHFYNPHSEDGYGATPSGSDYYFSRGNALFIVLNSNSRNIPAHRKLMKKAVSSHPDAHWRIVMMHHDIYGSGVMHSNRTSANLRTIFAPLMDEYEIDVVFSGHDHSYARSHFMLDGTAIQYPGSTVTDPAGTAYISLGTSSGSKMYGLASPRQFYVAERTNAPLPSFSILSVDSSSLSLKTYDTVGKPYADTFTIVKTKARSNPLSSIKKAQKWKKTGYTKSSFQKLKTALSGFHRKFRPTGADAGADKISRYFRTAKDPLSYYGYAAGTTEALPDGFSTLLDKTRMQRVSITASDFLTSCTAVTGAVKKLKKTSLKIKQGKKTLKDGAVLTLKKGKKLRLKIKASPSRYKVTCRSGAKKYVSISRKGVIRAKKRTGKKNTVRVTIRFQNRVIRLKIRVR